MSKRLGQAEVEHLHGAVCADFDIGRLQIPVDDPLFVRRLERLGDLGRDRSASAIAIAPLAIRPASFAVDEFHHEGPDAIRLLEPVICAMFGMIEGGEHLRLTPEPGEAFGIVGDGGQQNFDRDLAVQPRVTGLVHLAHSAHADPRRELIRADARAWGEGQTWSIIRVGRPRGP